MLSARRQASPLRPAQPGEALLRLEHVNKAFGDKGVFEDLSLAIYAGEVLSVIGESGAGKSVLLKCLIGLVRPDTGRILYQGQDLSGLPEDQLRGVRRHVAMVFQGSALFDSLSVAENVAYPLREHFPQLSAEELEQRVVDKLNQVGLRGVERLYPADLSGGMRKRVALARAIATDPEVVLWDEPTTGLDPLATQGINHLIAWLRDRFGHTSVVVTHDMASAFSVSDRIAMLAGRRVIEVGPPAQLRTSTAPEVRAFLEPRWRELLQEGSS
jgi:phospholipid/cholesterol/gamma-HCH transport system ATP-binding protein